MTALDIDAIRREARNEALRDAAEKCHKIAWPIGYRQHPSEYGKGSAAAFNAATECAHAITAMIEDKP